MRQPVKILMQFLLAESGSHESHFVDFLRVASSAEIIYRRVETLEDRPYCLITTKSSRYLITDVSCVYVREN